MQSALDSTSLAIARAVSRHETPPDAATLFSTIFTRAEVQGVSVTSAVQSSSGGSSVTASASGVMDAMFMRVVGIPQVTLGVTTKAFTSMDTSGCVLALDGNAANAMSLGGSTSVNLSGCSVFSNSVDAAALSVGGNATLSADMIGSAGGVSISSSNVTVTDGILSHMGPVSNPYADMQVPNFGACDQNNMKVKSDTTLDPGVYCNGISVNAGASLTLNPGIYYIDGGSLSANGGGTITGTGVTIVLTSSSGKDYATANINGNASISLTAPIAGPTAGLVIFEDPKAPVAKVRRRHLCSDRSHQLCGRRRNERQLHADHRRHRVVQRQFRRGDQLQRLQHAAFRPNLHPSDLLADLRRRYAATRARKRSTCPCSSATEFRTPSEARSTTSAVFSAARVASDTSLRTEATFEAPSAAAEMFLEISSVARLCEVTEFAAVEVAVSISFIRALMLRIALTAAREELCAP
jgi:hypothetical protein